MPEFFIAGNTPAAPFVSDPIEGYVDAATPEEALADFAAARPGWVYSACAYSSADAFHKREPFLAQWLCNLEISKQRATPAGGGYSFLRVDNRTFEVNGVKYAVEGEPFEGRVLDQALSEDIERARLALSEAAAD